MTDDGQVRRRAATRALRRRWPAVLGAGATEALGVVLDMAARGENLRVQGVARRMGASLNWTWRSLDELRERGLVSWERGRQGTIRPACRYTPAEDL